VTEEAPGTADVVVVGGGVMGASTAYHLAARGVDVALLEREPFLGQMSTGQCAGGIRHQFSTEINIRLSIESIRMMERFPEEPGHPLDLRLCGYLILLEEGGDIETFRENVALQHRLGVMTRWLERDEIGELVPMVDLDGVRAATFYDRDGLADPSGMVDGYAAGARARGARVLTGTEVTGIRTANGRIEGVQTSGGEIVTHTVVNACGAWAPQVGEMVGVDIPIVPSRRQIVQTTPMPEIGDDFPFTVFFQGSLYFHREGDGLLTGKSNPNEQPGYRLDVDPDWEAVHMEEAMRRLPSLKNAGIRSHWAGLYEITPDANPILGRIPTVEGFHVMAGFSGHGFMHGPAAGLLMAEEIADGKAHTIDIEPFRYERFLTGDLTPEYNVV
jgi:sarcosine oxidase subunit beta